MLRRSIRRPSRRRCGAHTPLCASNPSTGIAWPVTAFARCGLRRDDATRPANGDRPMLSPMPTVDDKRRAFRRLHENGCFVIPNPWDVGSARALQSLGFPALASTSSGLAWSQGRADGALSRDQVLDHLRALVTATHVPINADFESGYATTAAGVALSVRVAIEAGVAGLSIEDASGDAADPLFPLTVAVERLRAARQAIDQAG